MSNKNQQMTDKSVASNDKNKQQQISKLAVQQVIEVGAAPSIVAGKKKSSKAIFYQLVLFVLLPTIAGIVYFGFIASNRYVSSTTMVIQSGDMSQPSLLQSMLGGGMMGGAAGGGGAQGDILASYIQSASILEDLEAMLQLRKMYNPADADQFSKLPADASKEDFLGFYKSHTTVEWDASTSLLSVSVQAFSPSDAKLILDTIVVLGEERLNSLKERKQQDRVVFAKQELARAEQRLQLARVAVANFRRENGEIDPVRTAEASGGLLAQIQGQLTAERANLSTLLVSLRPDSPQVQSVKARIASLEAQAKQEKKSLAGKSGNVMSDLVSEFEELLIEEEFARATYTSALAFMETTRATAQQENSYVIDFVSANLPEESTKPERLLIILTIFIVSLLVLGIAKLIIAAIKEQAKL